jgi:DNA-binding GntR family transcriptional regulator
MPVPVVAEPISRVPTRETVADTLRGWIIDGTLTSCEVLRDADLAHAFGISRTPVREALLQLEHEGLVESQPGRWTRVTALDPEQLTHLFPVWVELESLVAQLAASRIGSTTGSGPVEEAAHAYAAAIDAALAEPTEEHRRAARAANAHFHDTLLAAAGNPILTSTLTPLRLNVRRFDAACPMPVTLGADTVEQHAGIVAAILAGDPETTAAHTLAHLNSFQQRLCAGWDVLVG